MKEIIKSLIPPIILKIIRKKPKYGFFGDYKSWKEALNDSSGYDDSAILEKVKTSLLKVKNGDAACERDSVVFDKIQHSWPLLASLLWIASKNENKLNILDFGGSLGSSYFQNVSFLRHLKEFRWNIVEQKNFVKCGKEYFENQELKFYESIENCFKETKPNAILISGTIQYLEKPYEFIKNITNNYDFDYVIFDRTTFINKKDRLTVQKVRPGIYNASYPAWFLNEEQFLEKFESKYELWAEFESLMGKIDLGDTQGFEKGYIFKKKDA